MIAEYNSLQYILRRWPDEPAHPQVNNVLEKIKACRTAKMGYHLYNCTHDDCGKYHYRYHSCRNRHCPQCGAFQKQQWIEDRMGEMLPTHYFHVVFTLPHELNGLVMGNRKILFNLLFDASSQTLLTFARDKKYLGAMPGILSVLHTWGQQLSFHPHVHCIVSSGGLAGDGGQQQWKQPVRQSRRFIFPVKAMSKVFRAKFLQALKQLHAQHKIKVQNEDNFFAMVDALYKKNWVVYAKKTFGGPQQVINYLGRYTHKTAISNSRIVEVKEQNKTVSFRYKDYADNGKQKTMTLDATEFIRRFSQHILPKGFTRIRSYGYLTNRGRSARILLITRLMAIPPHPQRVHLPWQMRLWIQTGTSTLQCPHCHHNTLVQTTCVFKGADDG